MAKSRRIYKILSVIIFLLWGLLQREASQLLLPQSVQAKEPSLPPHLIQSVSAQDIYKGMVAFELSNCPVLAEADREKACENVRDSVVRIEMGRPTEAA